MVEEVENGLLSADGARKCGVLSNKESAHFQCYPPHKA